MKKQKHRPQPRRKSLPRPKPMKAAGQSGDDRVEMAHDEYPLLLDMVQATHRAQLSMMPPAEAEEFERLSRSDAVETPETDARLSYFERVYKPTQQLIDAELCKIEAEYEANSRGSASADAKAAVEITMALIDGTLTADERAELDSLRAALPAREETELPGDAPEGARYQARVSGYLKRVPREEVELALHREGVSFRQMMARWPIPEAGTA